MPKTFSKCEVLAKINRDIAEGERHVAEQIALIRWMSEECLDTTLAQNLLFDLEQMLGHWYAHRRLILEANPQDQTQDLQFHKGNYANRARAIRAGIAGRDLPSACRLFQLY